MHISFTFVLTVLTLALSCVPAVLIWTIFSDLMTTTIDTLSTSSTDGIGELSSSVQDLLLRNALLPLNARIAAGDTEGVSQEALLYTTGLININLDPNVTNISTQVFAPFLKYNFDILKGNSMLSYIMMQGMVFPNGTVPGRTAYWIVWQVLNIDLDKKARGLPPLGRTIYLCTVRLSEDARWDDMQIWFVNQTTGVPLIRLSDTIFPWKVFAEQVAATWSNEYRHSWGNEVIISPYSGQVELLYGNHVPSNDGNQEYSIFIGLNVQTLSDELRSQLTNPNDRLFLFFRTANGHMLAASHGKFFSLSDVDFRYSDPISNPPNLSQFVFWTCLESTDSLIQQSCQQLIAQYHDWILIPELHQEMRLSGKRYWVAVGYSSSRLNATMVLLKDRQSIMGDIDASTTQAMKDTNEKRGDAAIVFAVTTAVAAVLPLVIGLWFGNRLQRLARGMDCIAKLEFRKPSFSGAWFREINDFQQSFLKMERGLQLFRKFVPSAVVTRLLAGHIHTDDQMESAIVTVMFADIECFSNLAEVMAPAQLAEVCTEYFEVMCKHVVQCDGTVDKFIGDCIMAMWNAPLPKPNHERSAVIAALRMQAEVLSLHDVWRQRGLPTLKFRMGIHTGCCLVGNFGCTHRVSYTCLGNNVNLASRLEALNKKFDTVLCVSQSTHAGCQDDFHFRHLSRVTVPGCSEVLSVYELIRAADEAEAEGKSFQRSFCNPSDVLPVLTKPMDDICLEPVDSPQLKGESKASPSAFELYKEPTTASAEQYVVYSSVASSGDREMAMPYHWGWHDRQAVLKEAAKYEAAYSALVEGRHTECHRLMAGLQPDKAWQLLAAQLEQEKGSTSTSNQHWDGVFRFREK